MGLIQKEIKIRNKIIDLKYKSSIEVANGFNPNDLRSIKYYIAEFVIHLFSFIGTIYYLEWMYLTFNFGELLSRGYIFLFVFFTLSFLVVLYLLIDFFATKFKNNKILIKISDYEDRSEGIFYFLPACFFTGISFIVSLSYLYKIFKTLKFKYKYKKDKKGFLKINGFKGNNYYSEKIKELENESIYNIKLISESKSELKSLNDYSVKDSDYSKHYNDIVRDVKAKFNLVDMFEFRELKTKESRNIKIDII